ncbi:hypothetical protein FRC0546_01836 [Corynebacterium diphtheriae]|nr:hypothetical protein FRC0546_01836 [Corynebacterium diphtheriae]
MRTNKKQQLLATAMDIVESDGLQGLTYDSLRRLLVPQNPD